MKHEDDPVDLTSKARRRALSRDEEVRLQALFEEAPEERRLYRAGLAFDRDSSAREGDDVLVARMAERAEQEFGRPLSSPPPRRLRFVTLVAAALVAAGSAAAGTGVVYLVRVKESGGDVPAVAATVVNAAPKPKAAPRGERRASAKPVAVVEETPVPAPAVDHAPGVVATPKRASREAFGAPALFSEANKRRLAGDSAGAVALYTELAMRYPGSAEANLAELSLAKLFLASGDSERALGYFRRAGATGGALGSEALWGEAEALRALGRTGEERETLERLLKRYPSGAYAKAARKRLGSAAP
jgi:TolA-binding protein